METRQPYNPLNKRNLGQSVAKATLDSPVHALPPNQFTGAGIYLIYYFGPFPPYANYRTYNEPTNIRWPIYVGKAVPPGARKGGFGLDEDPGRALYKRLKEHADSIRDATNLSIDDFACRYLVVDDIWIPLAESLLIEMFKPLWNKAVDGFGNHDPGSGRYNQKRSLWDSIHPGRPFADKLQAPEKSATEVSEIATNYLATPPAL